MHSSPGAQESSPELPNFVSSIGAVRRMGKARSAVVVGREAVTTDVLSVGKHPVRISTSPVWFVL